MKVCDRLRRTCTSNTRHKDVIIIGNGPSAITLSYILAGNHPFYLGDQSKNNLSNEELHCRLIEADESELLQFKQTEEKLNRCDNKSKYYRSMLNSDSESLDSQINELNDINDLESGNDEAVFQTDVYQNDMMFNKINCETQLDNQPDNVDAANFSANFSLDNKLINDQIVSKSLMERNLEYLSSGLSGRSINPVSVFLDQLQHPDADLGETKPSTLKWVYNSKNKIDHLAIGKGLPGGSWNSMADCNEVLTISLRRWMELPNYSIDEWSRKLKHLDVELNNRVPLGNIAEYYQDYVTRQNLDQYFMNNCQVKKVTFCEKLNIWCVYCKNEITKEKLFFTANHIVLATGNSDKPNKLNVFGEDQWFVRHYLNDLESLLKANKLNEKSDPVLIVGAGLSAADAIIACLQNDLKVIHVFRKHTDDPGLIFNTLPESVYPEYHEVYKRMKGELKDPNYKAFPLHCIGEIKSNREVVLFNKLSSENDHQIPITTTVKVAYVFSLIGMKPNLKYLSSKKMRKSLAVRPNMPLHFKSNPIKINPFTHESINIKQLYAIGPLAGDNFVRFLQGGALAVASSIYNKKKKVEA